MKFELRLLVGALIVLVANSCAAKDTNSTQTDGSIKGFPQWVTQEKIRAGWVSGRSDTKYVALLKSSGINTVLLKGHFHHKKRFKETLEDYRRWARVCKKERLHVFAVYHWQPTPASFAGDYAPVVYSEGSVGRAPCPRDHKYWQNYLMRFGKIIARLSLEADLQIDGVFLDSELYSNRGTGFEGYGESTCFCDNCFSRFLLSNGYSGSQLPVVERASRKKWMKENKLLDRYFAFLSKEVESLASKYEQELHLINPSLIIGMYPTPDNWVREALARGFGTDGLPMIIFGTYTYYGGGHRYIPDEPVELYRSAGVHALCVTGFLLLRYGPDKLAPNLYAAAEKCSGYWLFRMPIPRGKFSGEEEVIPGTQVEEYWQSIARANSDIDMFVSEGRTLIDKTNILRGWRLLRPDVLKARMRDDKLPEANFRGTQSFLVHVDKRQKADIRLRFERLLKYTDNLEYKVTSFEGQPVLVKEISKQGSVEISFKSPVTGVHLLTVSVGRCMFGVESSNCPIAVLDYDGFSTIGRVEPLYFYISDRDRKVVILGNGGGGNTFRIAVQSPENIKLTASTKEGSQKNNFRLEIKGSTLKPGIWNLVIEEADEGRLRDAYFNFVGSRNRCLAFRPNWIFVRD